MTTSTHHRLATVASLALCAALSSTAHAAELPGATAWDDSPNAVRTALQDHCAELRAVTIDPPGFPLAKSHEQHLLCVGFRSDAGDVDAIAFVFGDNRLVMIEARGGAAATFADAKTEEPRTYMHYQVQHEGERFIDVEGDTVWFLGKAALHPNLFTWSNPFLGGSGKTVRRYAQSAAIPAMLDFGGQLRDLRARFESDCPLLEIEPNQNIWLPHKPASQTQVNCFGFEYAGFPRKIEAVFGDGELEVVWILTASAEEGRVRQALIREFGQAEVTLAKWELFHGGRVALRKDKPEVLMISEKMRPHYESYFKEE